MAVTRAEVNEKNEAVYVGSPVAKAVAGKLEKAHEHGVSLCYRRRSAVLPGYLNSDSVKEDLFFYFIISFFIKGLELFNPHIFKCFEFFHIIIIQIFLWL